MTDPKLELLAKNICYLRMQMRLSLETLAEFVGSSRSNINKLENVKTVNPGLPLIESLAALFGVTVDQLRNEDLSKKKKRDLAIQRLKTNFNDNEFDMIASMIDGVTADQAHAGKFRTSACMIASGAATQNPTK